MLVLSAILALTSSIISEVSFSHHITIVIIISIMLYTTNSGDKIKDTNAVYLQVNAILLEYKLKNLCDVIRFTCKREQSLISKQPNRAVLFYEIANL